MKALSLLLAASLLANVAFVGVAVTRPPATAPVSSASAQPAAAAAASSDKLRAALASGDAAALEAAGLSAELAREVALGRTVSRLAAKARATQSQAPGDGRWWLGKHATASREAQNAARRELSAALGLDLGGAGDTSQLAFLPADKREKLRKIITDYEELFAQFGATGLQLPSDREKLRLLRTERERDIAALLSPEEKLAYDLRTSPTAASVRSRYGEAIESEAEFQRLFALQKAFDDQFSRESLMGRISPDVLRARSEAERRLEADMRAAVGDDRYTALRRAADPDIRNIDSLVNRLNLPPATTDTLLAARETYAAESQRINSNAAVPIPERRTQIQALADRAKADVTRTLGAEAGATYAQASPWIGMLSGGSAYTTQASASPLGGIGLGQQSVFPVLPAGATSGTTGTRTVFVGTPAFDTTIPVERAPGTAVQVMTFTTSTTEQSTATPPAQPATPPPPAPKQ